MVSQRRKQENGIVVNVFNFMLLALLLAVFALPSGVYAQCKTVKASTMSICVPSGWKVEVREVMEYNISSMIIVGGGRTYQFMEIHASIDAESLDWFIAQIMKRPEEHFNDQALKLTFNNAKWDKVKETTFQSQTLVPLVTIQAPTMRLVSRPFLLAATAATTTVSAHSPTFGVLRRAIITMRTTITLTPTWPWTWPGTPTTRTKGSPFVVFAIRAERNRGVSL